MIIFLFLRQFENCQIKSTLVVQRDGVEGINIKISSTKHVGICQLHYLRHVCIKNDIKRTFEEQM